MSTLGLFTWSAHLSPIGRKEQWGTPIWPLGPTGNPSSVCPSRFYSADFLGWGFPNGISWSGTEGSLEIHEDFYIPLLSHLDTLVNNTSGWPALSASSSAYWQHLSPSLHSLTELLTAKALRAISSPSCLPTQCPGHCKASTHRPLRARIRHSQPSSITNPHKRDLDMLLKDTPIRAVQTTSKSVPKVNRPQQSS